MITIVADLTDYVTMQALADIKSKMAPDKKSEFDARLVHLEAFASLASFLRAGGFLSVDGFFTDIDDEYKDFLRASKALRRKIKEVGVLYLDADELPHKDQGTWSSYHINESG
jgi:hypothetical protein